jgi:hypothetical protein
MPFKSSQQRKYFAENLPQYFDEWNKATGKRKLPKYVKNKKKKHVKK